jgi:hypothetical protein
LFVGGPFITWLPHLLLAAAGIFFFQDVQINRKAIKSLTLAAHHFVATVGLMMAAAAPKRSLCIR